MSNRKTAPSLRFRGFSEPWEEKELGEVATSYSGGTPTVGVKEYYDGKIPFIRSAEINSDHAELFISEKGLNNSSAKIVSEGDILYALYGATSGEVGRAKFEGAINQAILAILPLPSYDPEYLVQWLRRSKNSIIDTYLQGGQGNLSATIVKKLIGNFPSYQEQQVIGLYFQSLDRLIALEQRKYDKLNTVKKSMLEKMFPQKGAKVPEIRFKGFSEPWEEKKLGEIASVYDGIHQTPDYTDSGIMFLSVENIGTLKSEKYISEEAFYRDYKIYPQNGDILMTRIGDVGTPNVVETKEKIAFYVSLALLKLIGVDSYFLCNFIQSSFFQNGLKERTLVTAIPQKINKDEIGKIDVLVPISLSEQQAIGSYFKNLDRLITLQSSKIEKLRNLKKACLEKMFV